MSAHLFYPRHIPRSRRRQSAPSLVAEMNAPTDVGGYTLSANPAKASIQAIRVHRRCRKSRRKSGGTKHLPTTDALRNFSERAAEVARQFTFRIATFPATGAEAEAEVAETPPPYGEAKQ